MKSGLEWLILSREIFRVSLKAGWNNPVENENLMLEKEDTTAGAKLARDLVQECMAGLQRNRAVHPL